ncbi:MAG TPA: PGPGW domain-containing protein [Polyangiaceae bacterium]|nr:MAG: putative transmembrane protein (PGPGW) [Deltaproteobacteria bacterium ADurb.Bin207]HNS99749.1 PGPGW domain-containing protein [Polyangiaceae bacterium]HNZ25014.1 PGPGW domain-containing protein [Polyangiaceae bacterium]HOD23927.1 PGPGW domain-containing protein [Polyangiaceae bacterium]HOE51168.1 PGPGW domain-containing protein [Polyangiaceae bacterium]
MPEFLSQLAGNPWLWFIGTSVSIVLFVATLVGIPILCIRLPADYFIRPHQPQPIWKVTVRFVVASIVILMGIAMLVLPGQGLLTLLIGISLLDFPAKRVWQRRLLQHPPVYRALNAIRKRAGKTPFQT